MSAYFLCKVFEPARSDVILSLPWGRL